MVWNIWVAQSMPPQANRPWSCTTMIILRKYLAALSKIFKLWSFRKLILINYVDWKVLLIFAQTVYISSWYEGYVCSNHWPGKTNKPGNIRPTSLPYIKAKKKTCFEMQKQEKEIDNKNCLLPLITCQRSASIGHLVSPGNCS